MPSRLVVRVRVRVAIVAVQAASHHAALGHRRLLDGALAQAGLRLATLHFPPLGGGVYKLGAAAAHRGAAVAGIAASPGAVMVRSSSRIPTMPIGSAVFAMMRTS